MDVDQFIYRHQAEWARLEQLVSSASATDAADIDEVVALYQRASLHLSQARTIHRDPALIGRLSRVVAEANARIYGSRAPRFSSVRRFFGATLPAALWTCRRQIAASSILLFGTALVVGLIFWRYPDRIDLVMPASVQHAYLDRDFVSYYSENRSVVFFSQVTTNNIQVAILAYGLGALAVVPGALIIFQNATYLGLIGGLFAQDGRFWNTFVVYILPHGMLELTAIAIAGGAGMRVGWALFSPGDRSRTEALGDEGRRSITIVLGTALLFLGAGTIEGFVTGAPAIPAAVKVAVGVLAWAAFVSWAVVAGRRAVAAGHTGAIEELRPSWHPTPRVPLALLAPAGPRGYAADPLAAAVAGGGAADEVAARA